MPSINLHTNGHNLPPAPLDLRIVFISSYPPKRCGIGTYTKDLANSINNLNPEHVCEVVAMDDAISQQHNYPWEVSHRIYQDNWADYEKVLEYLNNSVIDIVSIQHEFGIYGGRDGKYIADFAKKLTKPFIVTLHTVLEKPNPTQKRIIQDLCKKALAVVVMLPVGVDILRQSYGVEMGKVVHIHHGAPDLPFFEDEETKQKLGFEGKIIMSSINLLSNGKGIEYAIRALPKVVQKYPQFMYLIVGQTHPIVKKNEGEVYRRSLEKLVKELGLENNVKFINEYISLEKLIDYIKATDFYITPYLNMEQISSGSLAYAIAAGRLCISTPYRYAAEMLAGGRGYLVEPESSREITKAILKGLSHKKETLKIREKCYMRARSMTWEDVGFRHVHMIDHLLQADSNPVIIPRPSLRYLRHFTTRVGLLEHSDRNKKNIVEGYSVDDNARGLIVAVMFDDVRLSKKYLNFIYAAEKDGKMYSDREHDGSWIGHPEIGDWLGRAFWAASYTVRYGTTQRVRRKAMSLVSKLLPACLEIENLRSASFVLLGLTHLKYAEWDEQLDLREKIINRSCEMIINEYYRHATASWFWPEEKMTYDNTRIPQAMIEIGHAYKNREWVELGLKMLDFVIDNTYDLKRNHFRFIGNKGWLYKGKPKADFDEQPIEAGSTVQACFSAFKATGLSYYREMAIKAFMWYHGDNIMRRSMYNHARASVYDGINRDGININQGTEPILEYLLGYDCYAKLVEEEFGNDFTNPARLGQKYISP